MKQIKALTLAAMAALTLSAAPALAGDDGGLVRVTITNLTHGQYFTPALVFSHTRHAQPFYAAGQPASAALEQLAEGGNTMPVLDGLAASGGLVDYASVPGLIPPGGSESVVIDTGRRGRVGLGAMLIPTNDGFIGGFDIDTPKGKRTVTLNLPAMDAGSELNDELCDSIPGPPPCGGEPVSAESGEGFVHVHGGIHGIGDLAPSHADWNNPVARVTIERLHD